MPCRQRKKTAPSARQTPFCASSRSRGCSRAAGCRTRASCPGGWRSATARCGKRQLSHDLIAIRFLIEPPIAALAARSAEETEIARLRGLAGEVEARILRGESHIEQDVELHTAIALCSRNLVVPRLIPIIHSTIQIFTDLKDPRLLRETIEIHRRVVDAIAAHNPVEAQDAMYLHLVHNRESLRAIERQQTTE